MSIKKIVLGFDFFDSTKHAVDTVTYLAKHCGSEVIPVHAVDHIPYHYGLNYWHRVYDELYPRMTKSIETVSSNGVAVRPPEIKEGRPYDVLLTSATEYGADLIVVGECRNSFMGRVFGPTANKLVRNAKQPVLAIRSGEFPVEIKRILCAVDLSVASRSVLSLGRYLAEHLDANLDIVHVAPEVRRYPGLSNLDFPVMPMDVDGELKDDMLEQLAACNGSVKLRLESIFDDYLKGFDLSGIRYSTWFRQGVPHIEILKMVRAGSYDLLLIGRKGQNNMPSVLIGNTTERILDESLCSVIVVPHEDPGEC